MSAEQLGQTLRCRCHSVPVEFIRRPVAGGGQLAKAITRRTVLSMTTAFTAHETILEFPQCGCILYSEALRRLVPRCCNMVWDVVVFVGRALFERHRNVEQFRQALVVRNVDLCASEIEYLGQKFITYLAIAHRRATPNINRAMQLSGGYNPAPGRNPRGIGASLDDGYGQPETVCAGQCETVQRAGRLHHPVLKQLRRD